MNGRDQGGAEPPTGATGTTGASASGGAGRGFRDVLRVLGQVGFALVIVCGLVGSVLLARPALTRPSEPAANSSEVDVSDVTDVTGQLTGQVDDGRLSP
ncbi:hypothetical protein [Allostreptomyces psammosilenae]|uniref:Uncharacterized protein n=1 Tax=Allostreptomyces psammosilenae TaxID=1892865 RepID=A0A853ADE9_9ACTN|nr:hypothetical protein [Allostreptomyces psammosilenae]NYI08468.1 hypothetical protein [Allostreptomyces psammosilenae]